MRSSARRRIPTWHHYPEVPDIVDVFRKGSDIPSVIDDVLAISTEDKKPVVWVQLGIWNQDAAIYGESKGLTVVMDRCIKIEHARFHGGLHLLGFDNRPDHQPQDDPLGIQLVPRITADFVPRRKTGAPGLINLGL